tara:strand:- start:696 stop:908 length:213 start_codon:yes stop_codon:yes gene_type:complete
MPAKYKPTEKIIDRVTKKVSTKHYYIKCLSTEALFEMLNDDKTKPKHKQKIRNEIVSRGVKIVRKVPTVS